MDLVDGQVLDASYDDDPDRSGIQLRVRVDASCWLETGVHSLVNVWIGKCGEHPGVAGLREVPEDGICEDVVDLGEESGCHNVCTGTNGGVTSESVEVCLP